jgi:hypothetical protein
LDSLRPGVTSKNREDKALLLTHLPTIVRFSLTCPYDDVRTATSTFLTWLSSHDEKLGGLSPPLVGPSRYVPVTKVPGFTPSSEDQKGCDALQLFEDVCCHIPLMHKYCHCTRVVTHGRPL